MEHVQRNAPCPCDSGKKYKKCCWTPRGTSSHFTRQERHSALSKLDRFVVEELGPEEDLALDEFWGEYLDREDDLDEQVRAMSDDAFGLWFSLDRPLGENLLVVDALQEIDLSLTSGERRYLQLARATAMRLYEVVDLSPGLSITLRDVLDGNQVTVHERSGSRSLCRFDWVAARVLDPGASGNPELEAGLLPIPPHLQQSVASQFASHRESYRRENPGAPDLAFFKSMPPFFHAAWALSMLDPVVPTLQNTDGEAMLPTRVHFEVPDPPSLEQALDRAPSLVREGASVWSWSGRNQRDQDILLGHLRLEGRSLVLETNSIQRAERGRALIEALDPSLVHHRATTHEDLERAVRQGLRTAHGNDLQEPAGPPELPPEVAEAVVLNHLAQHYRGWLDEPIPALEDQTPRQAAQDERLRSKLVALIHQLERMYESALKQGEPAYDPSWMWEELGLEDRSGPRHPPPLAHERLASLIPGLGEFSRTVAEHLRQEAGYEDGSTVLTDEKAQRSLEIQRFLRERPRVLLEMEPGVQAPAADPEWLASHVKWMVNFELHRRKTFWVDGSLAYLLAHTDLDVVGRDLRVPFPSFSLVFTDRYVLSLAERLLARDRTSALSGHLLRVMTVSITEQRGGSNRLLEIRFALDALGADPPHLVSHDIPLSEDTALRAHLDWIAPRINVEPSVPDANPLRGLLQVTLNAILYATSAGVTPEVRNNPEAPPDAAPPPPRTELTCSSEQVYFLPGTIEISRLRRMQELERLPEGRLMLRRFMVRGHWRRAAPAWTDQRMRWIEPYWKGPDMASVIERAYRLAP